MTRKWFRPLIIGLMILTLSSCTTKVVNPTYIVPSYTDIVPVPSRPFLEHVQEGQDALRTTGIHLSRVITHVAVLERYIDDQNGYYLKQIETITK